MICKSFKKIIVCNPFQNIGFKNLKKILCNIYFQVNFCGLFSRWILQGKNVLQFQDENEVNEKIQNNNQINIQACNIMMSFHQNEDEIKRKLLQVQIQNFRKHFLQQKGSHRMHSYQSKNHSNLQISEWSTNENTITVTSFPVLKLDSQNFRKNKIIQSPSNTTFLDSFFTKTNFHPKDPRNKASRPIKVNLSFNPFEAQGSKKCGKKNSSFIIRTPTRSQQKGSLQNYLTNGKVKMSQAKQNPNLTNRSDHLLRLLRQREILRTKRYSFDIEGGFMAKGYFNT